LNTKRNFAYREIEQSNIVVKQLVKVARDVCGRGLKGVRVASTAVNLAAHLAQSSVTAASTKRDHKIQSLSCSTLQTPRDVVNPGQSGFQHTKFISTVIPTHSTLHDTRMLVNDRYYS